MSIFQTILRDAVCTWFLQFSSLKCQVWLTWFFFPSLIWILLPTIVCKIQVWNGLKIKFIKLEISNWKIADRQGDKVVLQLIESWANFWAATFWVWIFYLNFALPRMPLQCLRIYTLQISHIAFLIMLYVYKVYHNNNLFVWGDSWKISHYMQCPGITFKPTIFFIQLSITHYLQLIY